MNHKWTPKGTYGLNAICIKCGMVRHTIRAGYNFRNTFRRESLVSQNKTPPCDETWPENWQPATVFQNTGKDLYQRWSDSYTLIIGEQPFWHNKKKCVSCGSFEEAKKHVKRFGMPSNVETNYDIGEETCHEFLKWMILECKTPKRFNFTILHVREHDEITQKTADLARLYCDYVNLCNQQYFL